MSQLQINLLYVLVSFLSQYFKIKKYFQIPSILREIYTHKILDKLIATFYF